MMICGAVIGPIERDSHKGTPMGRRGRTSCRPTPLCASISTFRSANNAWNAVLNPTALSWLQHCMDRHPPLPAWAKNISQAAQMAWPRQRQGLCWQSLVRTAQSGGARRFALAAASLRIKAIDNKMAHIGTRPHRVFAGQPHADNLCHMPFSLSGDLRITSAAIFSFAAVPSLRPICPWDRARSRPKWLSSNRSIAATRTAA